MIRIGSKTLDLIFELFITKEKSTLTSPPKAKKVSKHKLKQDESKTDKKSKSKTVDEITKRDSNNEGPVTIPKPKVESKEEKSPVKVESSNESKKTKVQRQKTENSSSPKKARPYSRFDKVFSLRNLF